MTGSPRDGPIHEQTAGRSVLWKQLDAPGMDACRYSRTADGWMIEGTAVSAESGDVTRLCYRITCGSDWSSRAALVRGWSGGRDVSLALERTSDGDWRANGQPVAGVAGLLDVDLGFTPASNTNALLRLNLRSDRETETTAVWLDTADWRIRPLAQSYRRLSPTGYAYRSPMHDYHAVLEVDDFGIVLRYPGLWEATQVHDIESHV